MESEEKITINLSKSQAMVLFEFFYRLNYEKADHSFEHVAEKYLCYEIYNQLETALDTDLHDPRWGEWVSEFREQVRKTWEK